MDDGRNEAVKIIAEDEITMLTQTVTQYPSTLEGFRQAMDDAFTDTFWPFIKKLLDDCNKTLTKHGYPEVMQAVAHEGPRWWTVTLDDIRASKSISLTRGYKFTEQNAPSFSDAWYAAQIGFKCCEVLSLRERGDFSWGIFANVDAIGYWRADWQWRRRHKPTIVRGRKVRAGAKAGGDARKDKKQPQTQRILAEMRRLISRRGNVKEAAEALARRGIGTARGNRRLWYRYRDENL